MSEQHDREQPVHRRGGADSRVKWVFFGFLALAAFFLFTEHRAHLLGILPWLFLLACPLMHIFMHGGHGGHGGHNQGDTQNKTEGDEK
ncbi:DUF2933 domain-containing protein [Azoarcus sp. CIB]|uniref:DUF2933 domain-containing protein n=1 Tax=Aromatoleum sp. (strain CIB) TaxID=198107 RepID=UPI00067ABB43|nr:DUF2933 domain-containing protein [Azoarcus sp. CIB]